MAFNFNGKTPKKVLFNGLNVVKLIFNGIVVWLAKVLTTLTGYPITLNNSTGEDLVDYKVYGNSIQDGTPTLDTPIEIKSVGTKTRNLLDNSELIINKHYSTTGALGNSTGRISTPKINVGNIDTVTIKFSKNVESVSTAFLSWDKDGNLLERNVSIAYKKTYATLDVTDVYQIAFFWWQTGITIVEGDIYDVMVCEGSEVLDYELYGYKIPVKVNDTVTDIYLKEPLRKIGDYTDYIDFANKKVVRNLIARYFDETTQLSSAGVASEEEGIYRYFVSSSDYLKQNSGVGGYCTHLPSTNTYYSAVPSVKYGWNNVMVYFFLPYATMAEYQAFFAEQLNNGTPFSFIVPRAVPLEEAIELPTILTEEGTNIIEVDTSIAPSNMEVQYYAKGV